MSYKIGVDIGGSFADFAVLDETTRRVHTLKVFSRPDSPGSEVIQGMKSLTERYGIEPSQVNYFTHGTTVGVNAVVQRKGLRLGLITTRNFEDVLDVARLKIPDMYHLMSSRPEPLITRDRAFGVIERLNADGSVDTPVDEASVYEALSQIEAEGCEAIVVSLLHSYRNDAHEKAVKRLIAAKNPALPVYCSHEVWPIIREYERTVTAAIGAYVQPKVSDYLTRLQAALADTGIDVDLKVTKSNGGVMSAENGKSNCIQMILSGTASGVIGAAYIATQCELPRCMSLDIGGTTADVALIIDGKPQFATGEYIGDFQIHIPSVSVSSIGDGGGSIAWVDDFGVLKVGPHSAGSTPGPVCYARGGTQATITDAFVVMGHLGQSDLGYNAVQLDRDGAMRAIGELAEKIGLSPAETAESIVNVSVSGMYAGVSRLVSRFGIDPRTYALMPFGGAGPMLACYLARELGMPEIVVPLAPGVLSAMGGLIADTKNDFIKTTYYEVTAASLQQLQSDYTVLEAAAREWIIGETGTDENAEITITADMRYRGQSFEIATPLEKEALFTDDPHLIRHAFHQEHEKLYGYGDINGAMQIVALRLVIMTPTIKPALHEIEVGSGTPEPVRIVNVFMDGKTHEAPVYARTALRHGHAFEGPAIVAQDDATTTVLPGFSVTVDRFGNMLLRNLTLSE